MKTNSKSEKEKQATKLLYITVGGMLAIMAAVILLSSMFSRAKPSTETADTNGTAPYTSTESKPAPEDSKAPQVTDKVTLPAGAQPENDSKPSAQPTQKPDGIPSLALPLDGILSKEFSDKTLVYSSTMEDYRTHLGIDINASLGDEVKAAADGKITEIWYDPMMGQCVKLEHASGLCTVYRNLSEELAENASVGKYVSEGDVIGCVGESAMIEIAQEPHLHFEATINGKYVDPTEYMSSAALGRLLEDVSYEG